MSNTEKQTVIDEKLCSINIYSIYRLFMGKDYFTHQLTACF